MSGRKYLTSVALIISLLLLSLQGLAAAKTPDWVYTDTRSTYEKKYFTGYGEGSDRASASSAAVEDAKENIAEFIGTAVFSTRDMSVFDLDGKTISQTYDSTVIQYSTAYDGSGMVIEERFYDSSKSCWVLVSIDSTSILKAAETTSRFRGDNTNSAYHLYGALDINKNTDGTVNPFDLLEQVSPEYAVFAIGYGHGKDLHTSIEKAQAEARAALAENRLSNIHSDSYMATSEDKYGGFNFSASLYSGALIFGSRQLAMIVDNEGGVWVLVVAPKDYVKGYIIKGEKDFMNAALNEAQFYYPIGKNFISTSSDSKAEYKVRIDTFKIGIPRREMPEWVLYGVQRQDYYNVVGGSNEGKDIYTSYRIADLYAREILAQYCSAVVNEVSQTDDSEKVLSKLSLTTSDALIPNATSLEVYFEEDAAYILLSMPNDDLFWSSMESMGREEETPENLFESLSGIDSVFSESSDLSQPSDEVNQMFLDAIAKYFGS